MSSNLLFLNHESLYFANIAHNYFIILVLGLKFWFKFKKCEFWHAQIVRQPNFADPWAGPKKILDPKPFLLGLICPNLNFDTPWPLLLTSILEILGDKWHLRWIYPPPRDIGLILQLLSLEMIIFPKFSQFQKENSLRTFSAV